MKKIALFLSFTVMFMAACRKETIYQKEVYISSAINCISETHDPSLRSYSCDSIVPATFNGKYCGFIPLNRNNYWVYEDSLFIQGVFTHVQYDTLRFTPAFQTVSDRLIWWSGNLDMGLPAHIYASEKGIYQLGKRLFTSCTWEANKEFITPAGESERYLARFEDVAAQGRSQKLNEMVSTPAGEFDQCIYFEKYSRNFRKDQVIIKPWIGVVKYVRESAPLGQTVIKLQQISTLKEFYIE